MNFKVVAVALTLLMSATFGAQPDARAKREALYRFNNLGVAYMEQYKHEDAVKQFKQAIASDLGFAMGHTNLALADYFLRDLRNAQSEAREAIKLNPSNPVAQYVLGAILKNDKQYDGALEAFQKVLIIDPKDAATNIQIGQIYSQRQQYEQAIGAFRRALDAEPYNATAAYSLATALNRSGNAAEGQKMFARFQELRNSGYATTLGLNYGEQGRYAEALTSTGAEPDLVDANAPAPRLVDQSSAAGLGSKLANKPISSVVGRKLTKAEFDNESFRRQLITPFSASVDLFDYDLDCKMDAVVTGVDSSGKPAIGLFHNEGGKLVDVTARSGLAANGLLSGAIFGDFDNDGKADVALFGYQTLLVYRGNGDGTFVDVTNKSGLPASYDSWAMTAAWVDYDHDGDLDLYVGNFADLSKWPGGESLTFPDDFPGQENKLFRNNGNGTFTDVTDQMGLSGGKQKTTAVVCTDFNNLRDIDLFVVNYGGPAQLFSNQRDRAFKDVAGEVGINGSGKSLGVAAGDINKDGFTDFYLPGIDGKDALYLSNGRAGFTRQDMSSEPGAIAAQFLDFDNDGLLDLILFTRDGLVLRRGNGKGFYDAQRVEFKLSGVRAVATADLNGDGGVFVTGVKEDGTLGLWRNETAGRNFVRVALDGRTSNRSGFGTKAELRSGSLRQKLEVYGSSPAPAESSLSFGLGYRTAVDALSLLWPAGIVQSELDVKPGGCVKIQELDRKGTSCPLLYAWNGTEYGFITDFLGGCAIGYLEEPGRWSYPDTDEYVRVTGDQLKAREGFYSLRMNNQLEEVIYFDAVKLLAVDHPGSTDIYPNERLMPSPPFPEFKVYSVEGAHPPAVARGDKGEDVLSLLTRIDRHYPEDFDKLPFKGYAREHTLTLDLGRLGPSKRAVLLMTAWIDYADSTANIAAAQAGAQLTPPYLQVRNSSGQWETVIPQMGFPAGLPKTMVVDLTGKFLCDSSEVRIVTSMRIYWDQILVDTSSGEQPSRVTTLMPSRASLMWRGFPREYSPDGRMPKFYDYRTIEPTAPWKAHLGNYTRYGDVRELLLEADDMYVITRSGDEIQLEFDGRNLPRLPAVWKRDFLVYADGFGKDMDIHSARPETIGELPFHGMKSYPYSAGDHYPTSKRYQEYLEKYNTRTISQQEQASWRGTR
jgi:tetratricopeptide (TPR) repeat protein